MTKKIFFLSLLCIAIPKNVFANPIVFKIGIHPELNQTQCSKPVTPMEAYSSEPDFLKLIPQGWVSLESHDYKEGRQFYPCLQNVIVKFPDLDSMHQFLENADGTPQYPFQAGADFPLREAIFDYVVDTSDLKAYIIILKKNGRGSPSEMARPLYASLRRKPKLFLAAFGTLTPEEKRGSIAFQYDFNLESEEQAFGPRVLKVLSPDLKKIADEFNRMIEEESKPRKSK